MGVLPYDFNLLLSNGQGAGLAVIQRNMQQADAYGDSPNGPVWQTIATVECVVWWDKSTGVRSANRTYVSPNRTVPLSQGGLVVAAGTDVTERDQITNLLTPAGATWITGLFIITGVLDQGTHMEIYIERSHLGG